MNKEVSFIILHLTPDLLAKSVSFQEAIQIIYSIISQNILYYKKTDRVGLMVLNIANEKGNPSELLMEVSQASFQMLKELKTFYGNTKTCQDRADVF